MNYFGAYHADIRSRALDSCDAPRISKGQMTVAGYETASNERAMALVYGRMRNRRALAKRLECTPYASQAALALLDLARKNPGVTQVTGIVDPGNVRSKRVLEKAGFVFDRAIDVEEDGSRAEIYLRGL